VVLVGAMGERELCINTTQVSGRGREVWRGVIGWLNGQKGKGAGVGHRRLLEAQVVVIGPQEVVSVRRGMMQTEAGTSSCLHTRMQSVWSRARHIVKKLEGVY